MSKPELRSHPTIADFLREFYGSRWDALGKDAQQVLVLDVTEVMEYEELSSPRTAISILDQRIENKLESYALTLMVGQRKRGRLVP